jgi:hypothetical protein
MVESRTAYRIETERLVIRCYQPSDAQMLKTSVDDSLEFLRPWMPWAHEEPKPLAEKVAMLRERTLRPDGTRRDTMIWSLFASDYPSSPSASLRIRAFDVLGEPFLG